MDRGDTLGKSIRRRAEQHPDRPALVAARFSPLSYDGLRRELDLTRSVLRRSGFGPTARIGISLPNGPEAVLALVAVSCAATAVPLDPRLGEGELVRLMSELRLGAVLLAGSGPSACRTVAEHLSIPIIEVLPVEDGALGLRLAVPEQRPPACGDEPEPGAPAFILQSSGTTGSPKLIPYSHGHALAAASRLQSWFRLTPDDRCLSVASPYYSHGLKVTVFTPLLTGGSIALPTNLPRVDIAEWFSGLRPTWYSAGPVHHRSILEHVTERPDALGAHRLRFIVSGGAPLPPDVCNGLQEAFGVPVLEHYGSSEAAQIAANMPPPGAFKQGTVGKPWPGTLAIVDENERPLDTGQPGQVLVRGPTVISAYLADPETNRAAFVDGWFRTGDLGSLDEEGFLTLHGRMSEVINRGSQKVAPLEVDQALLNHPFVAEAAAFSIPHPRLGQEIAAAVVLKPGRSASEIQLRQALTTHLAGFKIPRRIFFVDQIPKSTAGKVQRRLLADLLCKDSARTGTNEAGASDRLPRGAMEMELLAIWRRILKHEELTVDDDFFEKGGDSLLATEMLVEVEELVGQQLPEAVLFEAGTVRLLVSKIAEAAGLGVGPVAHFNPKGSRLPLILFHGDFDHGGLYVQRLARLLGPEQPVIAIAPHGARGEPCPATIEAMAADRLADIIERQPTGPYWLAGYCNGALVAYEVARLLTAAGQRVEGVAMIDPPTASARPVMRSILKAARAWRGDAGLGWVYVQMDRIEKFSKWSWPELSTKVRALSVRKHSPPASVQRRLYSVVMGRYLPSPLSVPIVFYAADHMGSPWRRLAADLETVEVPGGHEGCVRDHVEHLATDLRERIRHGTARISDHAQPDLDRTPMSLSK
jgi:oxalate---CoA ligase